MKKSSLLKLLFWVATGLFLTNIIYIIIYLAYIGNMVGGNYFNLMLKDDLFLKSFLYTFGVNLILMLFALIGIIITIILRIKSRKKPSESAADGS